MSDDWTDPEPWVYRNYSTGQELRYDWNEPGTVLDPRVTERGSSRANS